MAVGEDVAALVAFGCFGLWLDGVVHRSLPTGYFLVQSLRKKRVRSGLSPFSFAVKGDGPAFGRAFFLSTFILSNWVELKCQIGRIYFRVAGRSFWVGYGFCCVGF
jgi:hypothetical protein